MNFELGTGTLMMMNRETGEVHDWGEITPLSFEQDDLSPHAEPEKTVKGVFNSATISGINATINQDLLNELCTPSRSLGFTIEGETPILIQARWHKKARIRKKWLKRFGYKEDAVKMIAKARCGEHNTETNETSIDVDSIEYKFKPYQMVREVRCKGDAE